MRFGEPIAGLRCFASLLESNAPLEKRSFKQGLGAIECIGYGAFLHKFTLGEDELVDAVRKEIGRLDSDLQSAEQRLIGVQHALIDLLSILDPDYIRFPRNRRTKA